MFKDLALFETFFEQLPDHIVQLGIRILISVLVLIFGSWLIKLVKKLLKRSMTKLHVEKGVVQFMGSFVSAALYILLAFLIAEAFGIDAASIVALLGSAGVAIGLAIQGSLSNFAGGILILLLKPFKVGDYIKEDNKGNEGTVTEIQLFYTKLQTLDDKTVILPNGTLANTSLTNVSYTPYRMMEFKYEISYDSDLRLAYKIISESMKKDSASIKDKGFEVYMGELLADGVEVCGRCYIKNEDYRFIKQRMNETVKLAFDEQGVEIPYPQITIHKEKAEDNKEKDS